MQQGVTDTPIKIFKAVAAIILFYAAVRMFMAHEAWWFIWNVNLIMHEAGHVIMMPFGRFMNIFGGTLFEFGIPLVFALYFFIHRQLFACGFALWWSSTAFVLIARYAADAQTRILPLLGGDNAGHDWFNMLSMFGILEHTKLVSDAIYGIGVFVLIVAGMVWYADITGLKHRIYGIPPQHGSYRIYR